MSRHSPRFTAPGRPAARPWDGRTGETTVVLSRPLPLVEPETEPIDLTVGANRPRRRGRTVRDFAVTFFAVFIALAIWGLLSLFGAWTATPTVPTTCSTTAGSH